MFYLGRENSIRWLREFAYRRHVGRHLIEHQIMNEPFLTFKKFPIQSQAKEISILLNNNGIETMLTDNIANFDVTFSGNKLQKNDVNSIT